jgi:O-antigen ligase
MRFLIPTLLIACLVLIQCLVGGTRLVFSLPAYALAAAAAVLSVVWIRRPGIKPSTACMISALLLAGYVFCRAWVSPVPYLARTDAFMIAGALLVYLLTSLYIHEARARLWIVAALLVVAMMHVGVSLIQFHEKNGFMLFGFLRGDVSPRASGMLISGNHLAGYLESIALIALSITVWSRCRLETKMITGTLTVFCYAGVIVSGSRGGYLSTILSLVVFGILSVWVTGIYRRRNLSAFMVGTLVAGVMLLGVTGYVMVQSPFVHNRLQQIQVATKDVRIYNWLATLDQARLDPVWGTGAGTHLYYGRLFRRPEVRADPIHAHGDYLELLAEYGIVGELLALGFLATHLFSGLRYIREITLRRLCNALTAARSDTLALTLGATAAVTALIAHSVVDFNMHIPANALVFAFLFGVLCNPGIGNPGIDQLDAAPSWVSWAVLLRGGLAVLGIVTLAGVALRYDGEKWTEQSRVALRNQDYPACLEAATRAIKADPSNPNPYFYQGEALRLTALGMQIPSLRTVLFDKAIDAYHASLKLFPQDENLFIRLGQALDGSWRLEEAQEAYLQAINWDPTHGIFYAYYAAHLQLADQQEAAKKYLAAAQRLGISNPQFVGMEEIRSIRESGSAPLNQP